MKQRPPGRVLAPGISYDPRTELLTLDCETVCRHLQVIEAGGPLWYELMLRECAKRSNLLWCEGSLEPMYGLAEVDQGATNVS